MLTDADTRPAGSGVPEYSIDRALREPSESIDRALKEPYYRWWSVWGAAAASALTVP
jgi:hypothetical protein